jgi:hypothetical protein
MLLDESKQIILTSDRYPKELTELIHVWFHVFLGDYLLGLSHQILKPVSKFC